MDGAVMPHRHVCDARCYDFLVLETPVGPRYISFDYDVPYLGSSSEDGGTIYIQKGWVPEAPMRRRDGSWGIYNRLRALVAHEAVEWAYERRYGWSYTDAHHKGIDAEDAIVHADGWEIESYQATYAPELKWAMAIKNPRTPPDMFLRPYLHPHNVQQRRILYRVEH